MLAILAKWVAKPPTCLVPPAQSFVCFGLQEGSTEDSKFFVVASSGISLNLDKKAHTKDTLTYILLLWWQRGCVISMRCFWWSLLLGYHDNNAGTADGFEREIDDQHDKIDWDGKEPVHRLQPDDIWGTVVQWLHLLRFFLRQLQTLVGGVLITVVLRRWQRTTCFLATQCGSALVRLYAFPGQWIQHYKCSKQFPNDVIHINSPSLC